MSHTVLKFIVAASVLFAACGADTTITTQAGPAVDETPSDDGSATSNDAMPAAGSDDPDAEPAFDIAAIAGSATVTSMSEDLPADVLDCAIEALFDDKDLAIAVVRSDSEDLADLSPKHFDAAIDLVLGCLDDETFAALVVSGFEDEGPDLPADVGECFADEFDTIEERRALVELGLAEDGAADPGAIDMIVAAVVACVPADVWVEAMTAEIAADPSFETALQQGCLEALFADGDFVADLLTLAFNGEFDSDEVTPAQGPLIRGIFECVDFGEFIAVEAAADGVELQQSSIDCISEEFRTLGLAEMFITGEEPDDAVLGELVFTCLSGDELTQLLGR